ncbi:hypothetical protein [Novosphingobium terrae]|nr:hypothetical protein [Novosphingobium terrae]
MATTPEPPDGPQPDAPQVPHPSGVPYSPMPPRETPQDDPLPDQDGPGPA